MNSARTNGGAPRVTLIYPAQQFLLTESPRPDGSLGLLYVAGALRDHGFPVDLLDMAVGDQRDRLEDTYFSHEPLDDQRVRIGLSTEALAKRLHAAEIVGVSSIFTANTVGALEIARVAKRVNPEVLTVAGGGNARALAPTFLDAGFDLVVCGEGEETMVEICQRRADGRSLQDVAGIAWRAPNGEVA